MGRGWGGGGGMGRLCTLAGTREAVARGGGVTHIYIYLIIKTCLTYLYTRHMSNRVHALRTTRVCVASFSHRHSDSQPE